VYRIKKLKKRPRPNKGLCGNNNNNNNNNYYDHDMLNEKELNAFDIVSRT
jgi:hypothetical protein